MPIDYEVIHQASAYWKRKGYQYIDTPYWVSREAIDSTLPSFMGDDVNRFKVEGTEHHLVGSAEQSFYQMMLDGELEKGKYCSITPCFRDEPVLDRYHHQHFMKLELIEVEPDSPSFDQMVRDAMWFFGRLISIPMLEYLQTVKVSDTQTDINLNGVELGSYGFREVNGHRWKFGTGISEPRFSTVFNETYELHLW